MKERKRNLLSSNNYHHWGKIVSIWDVDTSTFRYRGEKNERHIERSLWKVCDPKSRRSVRIPSEARKPLGQKWKKDPGPLTQHPGLHLLFCYWLLQRRQLFLCYQRRRSPLRLSCSVFWCCPLQKNDFFWIKEKEMQILPLRNVMIYLNFWSFITSLGKVMPSLQNCCGDWIR